MTDAAVERLVTAVVGLKRAPGGLLTLAVDGIEVALSLVPPGTDGAIEASPRFALRYRLPRALTREQAARVRGALLGLLAAIRGLDAEVAAEVDDEEALVEALAALPPRAVRLGPSLRARPERLVSLVDRAQGAALRRSGGPSPGPVEGLAPCLDLAMRPPFRRATSGPFEVPREPPCAQCAVAAICPANERPELVHARAGLAPLRHDDRMSAARAAVHALAEALALDPSDALAALETLADDALAGATPLPFELSLKRAGARLEPALRVVSYAPSPGASPYGGSLGAARRDYAERCTRALDPGAHASRTELLGRLGAGRGFDQLSLGVESRATEPGGPLRTQLYVHVEPGAADETAAIEVACDFTGISRARVPDLRRLGPLVLLDHAPSDTDVRRIKLYFARPIGCALEPGTPGDPVELDEARFGSLAPFAAPLGLAVLELARGAARFAKWDAPCLRHFQRSGPLFEAFSEGLAPAALERVRALFDGRRFAAWPTWLSARGTQQTLYFVPR